VKMRKERSHYDRAFKENVVKLSFERANISKFARELGINPLLIHRWRKDFREGGTLSFAGKGVLPQAPQSKELWDLKQRLYEAEAERDILKKALNIISKSER
jgi:transposase